MSRQSLFVFFFFPFSLFIFETELTNVVTNSSCLLLDLCHDKVKECHDNVSAF